MLLVFLEFIQANPSVHALCLSSDYAVVVIQASPICILGMAVVPNALSGGVLN